VSARHGEGFGGSGEGPPLMKGRRGEPVERGGGGGGGGEKVTKERVVFRGGISLKKSMAVSV